MPRGANCMKVLLCLSLVIWHTDAHSALSIQPDPENTIYIMGESLKLRCVAETLADITGYTFYKDGAVVLENSKSNFINYSSLQTSDSGIHVCIYFKGSERSPETSFNLRVVERPLPPSLIVIPQKNNFVKDESAMLRCQPPKGQSATAITLYLDDRPLYDSDNFGVLNLTKIQISSSGNYYCDYEANIQERLVRSYRSIVQSLIVNEQPPMPLLLVVPQRNFFITDESAILQCQPPRGQSAAAIHLYHNGRHLSNADNAGVLNLTKLQLINSGNYSCIYEVKRNGQMVQSFPSILQSLTVTDLPPTPQLRYAYIRGIQITHVDLVCEVNNPPFSQIHGYDFYRNGIQVGSSGQAKNFTLKYSFDLNGCYSCRTFKFILEQKILSRRSSEHFLPVDEHNKQCQDEDMSYNTVLSHQGLKLYGSILAGKLLVLFFILITFGIHLVVIQQRNQKTGTNDQ